MKYLNKFILLLVLILFNSLLLKSQDNFANSKIVKDKDVTAIIQSVKKNNTQKISSLDLAPKESLTNVRSDGTIYIKAKSEESTTKERKPTSISSDSISIDKKENVIFHFNSN